MLATKDDSKTDSITERKPWKMGDIRRQRQCKNRLDKPYKEGAMRHENSMLEMTYLDHEQMRILILDTKNQVIDNISRYQGTVNSSVLRAAEIFRPAIIRNCPGVIVCHNHRR